MTEYEHVPTLPELAVKGLAHVVTRTDKGEPTHYRATAEGQALIDTIMHRNAEFLRAHPEASRQRTLEAIEAAKKNATGKKKK